MDTSGPGMTPAMTSPLPDDYRPPSKWPTTIGVISIVFGSAGLLCYGCGSANTALTPWLITLMPEDQRPPSGGILVVVQLFQMCSAFALSVWLLLAGIGLVRRRPWARKQCFGWSVVKILFTVTSTTISILLTSQSVQHINDQMSQGGQTPLFTMTEGIFIIIVLAAVVWALIWPVFLLAWFSRESVKQEVAAWEAESRAMI